MDSSTTSTRSLGQAQRKIVRGPSVKRRSKVTPVSDRVQLERVLGFTCNCNASLACDSNTGLIAYPAGCVVVLLNSKKNKQSFIQSKKTITCLAFSADGRHLVTGESGYQPMVRVWDLEERTQVAEFSGHKFGINCVVFSPNMKYIVSIGSQHDMMVSVWNWRSNTKVASNKVASKVTDISFSEDGSYFVTVGNRHVKFWYLDTTKSKVKEVVPLNGRSGILGEQKNNFFCGVACGRGANASKTFAITQSGLLCEFNEKRLLDKWVELRVPSAQCITVSEQHIFSGCADGVLRVFCASSLHYVTSLPKPHYLGVDITAGTDASSMPTPTPDAHFPDCVAVRHDETNKKVTIVYNDHSLYVWDVSNLKKVGKARSYMYHSACIWGVEVYPQLEETKSVLPPGSFITCSSDDTIRIWNVDPHVESIKRNIYSQDLLKIIYTDNDLNNIKDVDFNPAGKNDKTDTQSQEKNGVRCVKVSPDGQHLASGDRVGNIRVHDLQFMDQINEVEAHDSEVLCLEFTKPETGVRLLASAGRDRLLHVFDVDQNYGLLQILDDHSSAITSVHFSEQDGVLHMLSCGADKSILFRTAQQDPDLNFVLNRHLVGRTTLYDMDIDSSHKFVATACQDRNVRIYNIKNGKQKKCYKGSMGDDGTLIKVHLDPSGRYIATSCSNKTLAIMDFFTGECMSTMFGHSELVTGVRFTNDLKHLISVAADGCAFIWRLPLEFTQHMIGRMVDLGKMSKDQLISNPDVRRGTFLVNSLVTRSLGHLNSNSKKNDETDSKKKTIDLMPIENENEMKVDKNANDPRAGYRFSVGQLPAWAKRTAVQESVSKSGDDGNNPVGPRGRWAERVDNQGIIMKSMLDENSAIQLSLSSALDRRRFTVEHESIQEQIKSLRRDTIIKTDPMLVPIITDDDETNKDDEEDDEFCSTREQKEKRLGSGNEPSKKIEGMINTSRGDGSIDSHKVLLKTNSIDLLLEDDEEEEEEEEGDADSDQKDVIYFNEDGSESSETIASSFQVIEGDTTSYKDAESEGTDPLSLSDEESDPATPTTPGDPTKDFMSEAERDFEDLGMSPVLKEKFTTTLDDIDRMAGEDPSRFLNHRLSISSRFISQSQTQHLRNLAMQNAAQQKNTVNSNDKPSLHGTLRQRRLPSVPETGNGVIINRVALSRPDGGGWKSSGEEDTVPEKDSSTSSSHLVSHRTRPKLDPPPPPQPTRLSREDLPKTRHSLGPDQESRSRRSVIDENKDHRGRHSVDSSQLSRQWKSMADMSGRVTPTFTKSGQPPRSRTPTSYRSTTPHRNHSPVRYVAKTEVKLEVLQRGRSQSTQEEDAVKGSLPPPRSKSATPLDNTSKRKSLPRQHSYAKPTESSSAKTSSGGGPTTTTTTSNGHSPSKGRFANKKGGKLNSAMKSKFKSTPDLASALKSEELKPMPLSKTAEDLHDFDVERKRDMKESKTVRRSMPATREMKDFFGINTPAVDISDKAVNPLNNTTRKVSIGETSVIDKASLGHRKLPTPGVVPATSVPTNPSNSETKIITKASIVTNIKINKEDEDRLRMPPPAMPLVPKLGKNNQEVCMKKPDLPAPPPAGKSNQEMSLEHATAILQGKSSSSSESTDHTGVLSKVAKTSQEKEEPRRPTPVQLAIKKPPPFSENSLDVPLEGSPENESVPPPGSSMFHKWESNAISPHDLPVKDQTTIKPRSYISTVSRRFVRGSPSVGECDDGGDDILEDADVGVEDEPEMISSSISTTTTTTITTSSSHRSRDRSRSPPVDVFPSPSSTPGSSTLTSPTRPWPGQPSPPRPINSRTLPELPLQSKTSPLSSGNTSPLHGSPRLRPRHLRKSDEGPVAFGHGLRIAFTGDINDSRDSSREGSLSPTLPSSAPLEGGFGIPKSKSMPEVTTDNKALDELCQSVTAKLDALVNKPLPGRSPKSLPQTPEWRKKSMSPGETDKGASQEGTPDTTEADAEIKRPDKSRTMPPTSLTTSLPSAPSSAKLVLTSPVPADRSRLSLPVSKVNTQPEGQTEPLDEDACRKMAEDLKVMMEKVVQAFNQIPKEKKQSHILQESLSQAQSTLNDTLGASGASGASQTPDPDSNSKIISDAAEKLVEQAIDLLKGKLEQALQ